MKRLSLIAMGLCTLLITLNSSCKKDDTPDLINAPQVTGLRLTDIGDNGDATDMQVSFFRAGDESMVAEYRLFIVPESFSFDLSVAEGLANGRYLSINPNGQNHTFTLSGNAVDAEGNPIVEASVYQGFVLSIANGTTSNQNSLSTGSIPLELLNKDIVLDRVINAEMAALGLSSVSIAAVANGEVVLSKGYGVNSVNRNTPSSGNSLYIASSISKLFVGTAIMQQYEKGRIDLDEDAGTYLGYPLRNPKFPEEVITVRTLLSHQASLANPGQESQIINSIYIDSVFTMGSWIKSHLLPGEPDYNAALWKNYAPNTQHVNSNLGVTLLAHLVEKVDGREFRDYAEQEIFAPLGMDHTAYRMSTTGYFDEELLTDVFGASGNVLENYFEGALYPAGWMRLSVADAARFTLAVLNKGELEGHKFMEEATVDKMLDVQFPDANLAFGSGVAALWRAYSNNWLGHTAGGIVTGSLMLNPETNKGFVVMTNKRGILSVSPDDSSGKIYQALEAYLRNF